MARITASPFILLFMCGLGIDCFEIEQKRCWRIAASTLAMSISWKFEPFDYNFRRLLLPHISSCLNSHKGELYTGADAILERLKIAEKFALVYQEWGRLQEAMEIQ